MEKRLDEKLRRILADPSGCKDFMIADAKDGDMGGGRPAPGPLYDEAGKPTGRFKTLEAHRQQIRDIIVQDIVDVMLMSASNCEQLAVVEGLFDRSPITPAIRANDTTDIWGLRGGRYKQQLSVPFRTASLDPAGRTAGADLGLYSITFNNDAVLDTEALLAFRHFRHEAQRVGFRYFLEVFNPVAAAGVAAEEVGSYVNDCILRALAGLTRAERPLFLKVAYNGPRALDELVSYDPTIVVGILGGAAGTTHDTFKLLSDVRRGGARLVLFGRKINLAEDPLAIIALMRRIADGEIGPEEAVRAYHGGLQKAGLRPRRPLAEDLAITDPSLRDG
jgi:hypothetical protein